MATKLSRQIPSLEEYREISKEILNGSDRSVAIILAAEVERFLEFAILSKLTNINDHDKLVGHDGPLATFSRKIHIGYAMGLYDVQFRDDLTRIKDIRNDFAHSVMPLSFNTTSVKDRCSAINQVPAAGGPTTLLRWGLEQGPVGIKGLVDIIGLEATDDRASRIRFIVACNCVSAWLYRMITNAARAPGDGTN
jgi:hypothetical protein